MKKLLLTVLSLAMMLGAVFTLASCGDNGPKKVQLVKDGATEYSLTYSEDLHEDYAYLLYYAISDIGCDINFYEYSENANAKEIVIGDTDRQISVELKAAAEALKTADDDLVWAYGYKNGVLGFYANSKEAASSAWDAFNAAITNGTVMECAEDFWVTGQKTYAQYQDDLLAADNADDAEIISELKKSLQAFSGKSFASLVTFPKTFTTTAGTNLTIKNPTVRPIDSHPRIWVNSESLPEVKASLNEAENKAVYSSIKAAADAALLKDGKLPNEEGNFSDDAMVDIENLAFMYLVTGREKYGYAAILHAFNNMTTYKIFPVKTSNDSNAYSNSVNGGTGLYIMAEVYDWCYDLFDENLRDKFVRATCEKFAAHLEMGYPPTKQEGIAGHGTGLQLVRNWLAFAIATEDEYPQFYNFVVGRLEAEYVEAPERYYQSGMNFHGSPYGAGKTEISMQGQILFEIATGKELFENVDFVPVVHSYLHRLRPDDTMTRVGDDYAYRGTSYEMKNYKWIAFYTATYYNDPLSKTWYKYWSGDYRYGQFTSRDMDATAPLFILLNDVDTPVYPDRYSELSLVYHTEYPLSSQIARSSWNDQGAWMTFTNICETYIGNHQHMDAGTFQIYYKGILAPDAGAYQYGENQDYGAYYDYAYVKQTVSKNGLLIYNPNMGNYGQWKYSGGQSIHELKTPLNYDQYLNSQGYNQAVVLGKSSEEKNGELVYSYISGDMTNAYDSSTVSLVSRSTFTLATGDEANPMAFIVYDRIISKNSAYEKSFVLHTTNKPVFGNDPELVGVPITEFTSGTKDWRGFNRVTGTNTFYYDNTLGPSGSYDADIPNDQYNGQLTVQTLLPENPIYNYVGGDGKRFWVGNSSVGIEYTDNAKFQLAEIGWGRVEIVPSVQSKDDSFLNVMYVGDAGVAVTEQATLVPGSTTHEGVVTYGSCVMFAKTDKTALTYDNKATEEKIKTEVQKALVSDTVSFNTTDMATGNLNYYVTGLAAGTWTVTVGNTVKTVEVTAEGAIAVFEAPAGEVTLTPDN